MTSEPNKAINRKSGANLQATVPTSAAGERLDSVAARLFDDYLRSRLQSWIVAGHLTVDGSTRRIRDKLLGGEVITLMLPADASSSSWSDTWANGEVEVNAEAMPIELVHSDAQIHVINKPAGLVMHPAPGNRSGTLMNGLLHLDPALKSVPRAGIVHRLDKDTSGLLVVARTLKSHTKLVSQLQARTMGREYLAIALGDVPSQGSVDKPIARHPKDRKRMAVVASGKPARTHYRVLERLPGCALLAVKLDTGRTHQIRVHMTHLGFPLLGDPVYGRRPLLTREPYTLNTSIADFSRQALHAHKLCLLHPESGENCEFEVDISEDFQGLLAVLRGD